MTIIPENTCAYGKCMRLGAIECESCHDMFCRKHVYNGIPLTCINYDCGGTPPDTSSDEE